MVVGVAQMCPTCGKEFRSCVMGGQCVECDMRWGITKEAWAQAVQQMPPPLDKTSEQEIRAARDEGSCAPPLAANVLKDCGVVDQKEWPMDGDRPLTFQQIQAEIGRWSTENFGNNVSKDETSVNFGHPLGSLPSLLGMQEELGELARAVARRHQGRGYDDPKDHRNAKEDALSDLLVFMCDYATREGIDLMVVLNRVWQKVKLRRQKSWAADKAREEAEAEAAKKAKKADAEAAGRKVAEMVEKALIGQQTESTEPVAYDNHGFGHAPDAPT
jgi:NTP pyrophosphatase (non-canonical NTP hydrolase)